MPNQLVLPYRLIGNDNLPVTRTNAATFRLAGTSTLATGNIFSDQALTVNEGSSIDSDDNGRVPQIWTPNGVEVDATFFDNDGNQLFQLNPVPYTATDTTTAGGITFAATADVAANDVQTAIGLLSARNTALQNQIDTLTAQNAQGIGRLYFNSVPVVPDKHLFCDGAAYSRTSYADLFNVIGTTYGPGDGITTFNVPDWRGQFPRGFNPEATGLDAGRVFGVAQDWMIPDHQHGIRTGVGNAGSNTAVNRNVDSSQNNNNDSIRGIDTITGGNITDNVGNTLHPPNQTVYVCIRAVA